MAVAAALAGISSTALRIIVPMPLSSNSHSQHHDKEGGHWKVFCLSTQHAVVTIVTMELSTLNSILEMVMVVGGGGWRPRWGDGDKCGCKIIPMHFISLRVMVMADGTTLLYHENTAGTTMRVWSYQGIGGSSWMCQGSVGLCILQLSRQPNTNMLGSTSL